MFQKCLLAPKSLRIPIERVCGNAAQGRITSFINWKPYSLSNCNRSCFVRDKSLLRPVRVLLLCRCFRLHVLWLHLTCRDKHQKNKQCSHCRYLFPGDGLLEDCPGRPILPICMGSAKGSCLNTVPLGVARNPGSLL